MDLSFKQFTPDMAKIYHDWVADPDNSQVFNDHMKDITIEDLKSCSDDLYTVYKGDTPIGFFSLISQSEKPKIYSFNLMVIKDFRNNGIGTYISDCIITNAFANGADKIVIQCNETQENVINYCAKRNFLHEGILKKESIVNGQYLDDYRFCVLREGL